MQGLCHEVQDIMTALHQTLYSSQNILSPAYDMFLVDFGARTTPSRRMFHTARSLRIRHLSRAQYLLLVHIERRYQRQILPTIHRSDRNVIPTQLMNFVCVKSNDPLLTTRVGYSELYLPQRPHPTITIGPMDISKDNYGAIHDE